MVFVFLFKQKTAYDMRISDWSSDVCSSDLGAADRRYRCRSPCRSLVSGVQYPATLAQGSAILPAFSAIKKTACSTVSIPANLGGGRGMSDNPRSEEHTSAPVTNAHLVCRLLPDSTKPLHIALPIRHHLVHRNMRTLHVRHL